MVVPVVGVRKRDGDQKHAVLLRRGNKTPPAALRIAGLDADHVLGHTEQAVVVDERARTGPIPFDDGVFHADEGAEQIVSERFCGQPREVAGGRVVLLVVQPVRIDEMGRHKPELRGLFVHQLREGFDAARRRERESGCRVVRAFKQNGGEQIARRELFAGGEIDA